MCLKILKYLDNNYLTLGFSSFFSFLSLAFLVGVLSFPVLEGVPFPPFVGVLDFFVCGDGAAGSSK